MLNAKTFKFLVALAIAGQLLFTAIAGQLLASGLFQAVAKAPQGGWTIARPDHGRDR